MDEGFRCETCGATLGGAPLSCPNGHAVAPPLPTSPSAPTGLSPRPDPYAQINNPLHTDWGHAPTQSPPVITPPPPPTPPGRRTPWTRRLVAVVALALLAAGLWLERDRISDLAHDLGERISGESALDQPSVVDGRSDTSVGSFVAQATLSPITT